MDEDATEKDGRPGRWVPWSGLAASLGALLWLATPWVRDAVLGTRPYVASVFDVGSLAGVLLMTAGLVGVRAVFGGRYGRLGRVSVGMTAVGMTVVAGLSARSVVAFVDAGFRAVPATGEDPAGLVLTFAALLGLGCTFAGAGGIGLALRRIEDGPVVTSGLLLLAPAVPLAAIALRLLSALPLPLGRLVVGTNVVLVPLGLGWVALGLVVRSRARSNGRGR